MDTGTPSARTRRRVLGFASTLAVITYVDRVCISQAAPSMQHDLGLTAAEMGLAFSAFAWAYALFEIPGGWLGDALGPRKVLMRVVLFWSVFTAATGYVRNMASLVIARFLFGMGEAGCFPNLTRTFVIWLPVHERTRAQGILWLSARWGGAFTPLLVIWVMSVLGWRNTFVLFGAAGVFWAIFFQRWFPGAPGPDTVVEPARERTATRETDPAPSGGRFEIPWRRWLTSRTVWLLWLQYFCLTYGWFFYVTWLPTYLKEVRGLDFDRNAFVVWLENGLRHVVTPESARQMVLAALAGVPLFIGGLGAIVAGGITPRLARSAGTVARARRTLALTGFTGASVLLVASSYIRDPLLAMAAMGIASFCNDLTMPGSWSVCMDAGGRFAGTLSGSMNMMGSLGAATAPLAAGLILDHSQRNWTPVFWMAGAAYLLGALCWMGIDPAAPIGEREFGAREPAAK